VVEAHSVPIRAWVNVYRRFWVAMEEASSTRSPDRPHGDRVRHSLQGPLRFVGKTPSYPDAAALSRPPTGNSSGVRGYCGLAR